MKSRSTMLKNVTRQDLQFLYELLLERNPIANISHKVMPTFAEHTKFVMSKPYLRWYIVYVNGEKSGTAYLTRQNEIGIFIKKGSHGVGIGSRALELIMEKNGRRRYLANISPKNKKSIKFFTSHGFKLIQYTYELIKT